MARTAPADGDFTDFGEESTTDEGPPAPRIVRDRSFRRGSVLVASSETITTSDDGAQALQSIQRGNSVNDLPSPSGERAFLQSLSDGSAAGMVPEAKTSPESGESAASKGSLAAAESPEKDGPTFVKRKGSTSNSMEARMSQINGAGPSSSMRRGTVMQAVKTSLRSLGKGPRDSALYKRHGSGDGLAAVTTAPSPRRRSDSLSGHSIAPNLRAEVHQQLMMDDPNRSFIGVPEFPYVVIMPKAKLLMHWKGLVSLVVMANAIITPAQVAFDEVTILSTWGHALLTTVYLLDFGTRFCVPFYTPQGDIVLDTHRIAERYFQSGVFWFDLAAGLPMAVLGTPFQLVSCIKTVVLLDGGEAKMKMGGPMNAHVGVIMNLVTIFVIALHWVACGWNCVGSEWRCNTSDDIGLRTREECWHGNFKVRYTACLYNAAQNLFGGGISITEDEHIFFVCVVIVGTIAQAAIIGSVANALRLMGEDAQKFDSKVGSILHRLKYLELPAKIQYRVTAFYENLWTFHRSLSTDTYDFIDELPAPLQLDIRLSLFKDMLLSIPFLKRTELVVVEALLGALKTAHYLRGDLVMRRGEPGEWMAFVSQGLIGIVMERNGGAVAGPGKTVQAAESAAAAAGGSIAEGDEGAPAPAPAAQLSGPVEKELIIIKVLRVGDYLGEMALLTDQPRSVDVKALSWVSLQVLHQSAWKAISVRHPKAMNAIEEDIARFVGSRKKENRRLRKQGVVS